MKQYKNIPLNKTQSSFNQTKQPNYDISNILNTNFNSITQTQIKKPLKKN